MGGVHVQSEIGVDAGVYARQLMGHAKDFADKWTADGGLWMQQAWKHAISGQCSV